MPAVPRTVPEIRRKRTGATLPSKRSPEARDPRGMNSRYVIKKAVPGRHYIWVYEGSPDAIAQYEGSGYRYETWKFRVKGGKVDTDANDIPISTGVYAPGARPDESQNGKRIKVGDQCLMSCDQQRKADIDEYGHDGETGQYLADMINDRIISDKQGVDLLRGIGVQPRHVGVTGYGEHGAEHGLTTREDRP